MREKTLGFIGGGRVARILLGGFNKAGFVPASIIASDTSSDALTRLRNDFPSVQIALNDNRKAAGQDLIFLGLHPPAIVGSLADIKDCLKSDAVLISLAPKLTIAKLAEELGGFDRIVRMIPNAASIIGEGYNPIAFSDVFAQQQRQEIKTLVSALGYCPEVEESKLEAYAMITAMGPTYLWFQLNELQALAQSFGMAPAEAETGVAEMAIGAAKVLFKSGMVPDEVVDLIPVKPLGEEESTIRKIYRSKLEPLYKKLKS